MKVLFDECLPRHYWKRLDGGSRPGYAELERVGEEVIGKHLNYTGRSQFDPEKKTETPFILKVE